MKASNHSDQQLDNYIFGRMSAEERETFERQLAQDDGLKEALVKQRKVHGGIEAYLQASVKSKLQGYHQEWEKQQTPSPRFPRKYIWFIAAALLLLSLLFVLLLPSSASNEKMYAQYFEPYPMQLGDRSQDPSDWMRQLEDQYTKQNYAAALQILQAQAETTQKEKKWLLYLGICQLESDQITAALSSFEQFEENDPVYWYEANWYAALAHLKAGQLAEAKKKLNILLAHPNAHYDADARRILDALFHSTTSPISN
ncbi:MAG: tetratricopeptide repeat protein [Bacteroidota bacterium]